MRLAFLLGMFFSTLVGTGPLAAAESGATAPRIGQEADAGVLFTLGSGTVKPGEGIKIKFTSPQSSKGDNREWISVVEAGKPDGEWGTWKFVSNGAKAASLKAPAAPGSYEVRLHNSYPGKSFNVIQRVAVIVAPKT